MQKVIVILLVFTFITTAFSASPNDSLIYGTKQGNLKKVNLALKKGADINCRGHIMRTPLMTAISYNHPKIAEELIKKGADVNLTDEDGRTALMYASEKGHYNAARLLIEKKAKINTKDMYKFSAIIDAARWGRLDIVKLLIENNALVNDREKTGRTPLMWAAASGKLSIVKYLLSRGAVKNMKTTANVLVGKYFIPEGSSAQDLARIFGHRDVEQYIKSH